MKLSKNLGFNVLRNIMSSVFRKIPDSRQQSKVSISIHDALMSGLACMYYQDPSLLQFQDRLQDEQQLNNLQTMFNVENIPKETQMREIIDRTPSEHFNQVFKDFHMQLDKSGQLSQYELLPGRYYYPIDGTQYFTSKKVNCEHCLIKRHIQKFSFELLSEHPEDINDYKVHTYIILSQGKEWQILYVENTQEFKNIEITDISGLKSIVSDKSIEQLATGKIKKQINKILKKYHTAHAKESITYSHQVLQGGIMHPSQSMIIPFMPEEISNTDGKTKQDCEMNAAKRHIEKVCREYTEYTFIFGGDSLYSKQPIIEYIRKCKQDYLFSVKLTDHKYLKEWLDYEPPLKKMKHTDKSGCQHYYEWINSVPLNGSKCGIRVNFIRYKVIDSSGKIKYQNHWVTDIEITRDNIKTLIAGGRCRWKAENECFNVLKNGGYCLEHSYGHGKENACLNFYLMTVIAFFMHQIFELTDSMYQTARKKFGSKKHMWETLRSYIRIFVFDSWDALLNFSLSPQRVLGHIVITKAQPP